MATPFVEIAARDLGRAAGSTAGALSIILSFAALALVQLPFKLFFWAFQGGPFTDSAYRRWLEGMPTILAIVVSLPICLGTLAFLFSVQRVYRGWMEERLTSLNARLRRKLRTFPVREWSARTPHESEVAVFNVSLDEVGVVLRTWDTIANAPGAALNVLVNIVSSAPLVALAALVGIFADMFGKAAGVGNALAVSLLMVATIVWPTLVTILLLMVIASPIWRVHQFGYGREPLLWALAYRLRAVRELSGTRVVSVVIPMRELLLNAGIVENARVLWRARFVRHSVVYIHPHAVSRIVNWADQ